MIRAGADTSGNRRYISIVMGISSDIKTMHTSLGCDNIHMRKLCKRVKNKVRTNFTVSGDIFIACIEVNKPSIVANVHKKLKGKRHKKFVEDQYDDLLKYRLKQICDGFLRDHNIRFEELRFEIDHDLRKAFSHLGIRTADESITHQIADVVANQNSGKKSFKGICEKDISKEMENLLTNRLKNG